MFVLGVPLEELLFAFGFGMYRAGVYDHFTRRTPSPAVAGALRE